MGWSNWFTKKSNDWFYAKIPNQYTPEKETSRPIVANEDYLSITLNSLRIDYVRKGFSSYYGTVHSHISLLHRKQVGAEFNVVTKPGQLATLAPKHIYNVIAVDTPLLTNVPFRGGDVALELGLFSIEAENFAKPFVDLLSDMSGLAGVRFVGSALPYVAPIVKGINLLADGEASRLEIGLSKTFSDLQTGYYAIVKANRNELDNKVLKIGNDSRLEYEDGKSVEDFAYMVFQVKATRARPDWFEIPDIAKSYQIFESEVDANNQKNAEEALTVLRRTLLLSPDLLRADALNIFNQVEKDMEIYFPSTKTSRSDSKGIRVKKLSDYSLTNG